MTISSLSNNKDLGEWGLGFRMGCGPLEGGVGMNPYVSKDILS